MLKFFVLFITECIMKANSHISLNSKLFKPSIILLNMTKKDTEKAIKSLLRENKNVSFTQSEISEELGVPVWDVVGIVENFKKRGLVVEEWQKK